MGIMGTSIWDLIGREDQNPEEEKRRQMMEETYTPPEVDELSYEGDTAPTVQMPQVSGLENPELSNISSRYGDWMNRQPYREDYKPSTGRNILAGLAGFLSAIGGNAPQAASVVSQVREGPYRKAVEDWQTEGKALGDVGDFAQKTAGVQQRREATAIGFEETQRKVEAQRSAIAQRKEAEDLRHKDRMDALTEDSEKRKEVGRHNKEVEKIAKEENRIRGIEAAARTTSANAYKTRVGQLGKEGDGTTKPFPAHYRQAVMDEIGVMLPSDPQAQKWFVRDPRDKSKITVKPRLKLKTPDEMNRFKYFIDQARKRAAKNMNMGEGDVEDYNPYRQDIP